MDVWFSNWVNYDSNGDPYNEVLMVAIEDWDYFISFRSFFVVYYSPASP